MTLASISHHCYLLRIHNHSEVASLSWNNHQIPDISQNLAHQYCYSWYCYQYHYDQDSCSWSHLETEMLGGAAGIGKSNPHHDPSEKLRRRWKAKGNPRKNWKRRSYYLRWWCSWSWRWSLQSEKLQLGSPKEATMYLRECQGFGRESWTWRCCHGDSRGRRRRLLRLFPVCRRSLTRSFHGCLVAWFRTPISPISFFSHLYTWRHYSCHEQMVFLV